MQPSIQVTDSDFALFAIILPLINQEGYLQKIKLRRALKAQTALQDVLGVFVRVEVDSHRFIVVTKNT